MIDISNYVKENAKRHTHVVTRTRTFLAAPSAALIFIFPAQTKHSPALITDFKDLRHPNATNRRQNETVSKLNFERLQQKYVQSTTTWKPFSLHQYLYRYKV